MKRTLDDVYPPKNWWSKTSAAKREHPPWELKTDEDRIVWNMIRLNFNKRSDHYTAMFSWERYSQGDKDAIASMIVMSTWLTKKLANKLLLHYPLPWSFKPKEEL